MFLSCSANGQVSMAELRVFQWGLLVKSGFFLIKWKMSSEQVHRATGEAELQFCRLRSLLRNLLQPNCRGMGQILMGKTLSRAADTNWRVMPRQQSFACLVPEGPGRLWRSRLWGAENVICETGGLEAWLFVVRTV